MSVRYAGWNLFGKGSNKADMYQVSAVESMYESPVEKSYCEKNLDIKTLEKNSQKIKSRIGRTLFPGTF